MDLFFSGSQKETQNCGNRELLKQSYLTYTPARISVQALFLHRKYNNHRDITTSVVCKMISLIYASFGFKVLLAPPNLKELIDSAIFIVFSGVFQCPSPDEGGKGRA